MVVGELTVESDLVVIGGGPGGYSAAFRAADLGVETTIVDDREALGGAWLHEGGILSKELLHLADTVRAAEHAATLGVVFGSPRFDLLKLRNGLQTRILESSAALDAACRQHEVTRVQGRAHFDDSRQLSITNSVTVPRIRFKRAVIATGAAPVVPLTIDRNDPRVMLADEALRLETLPETMLVVGGSSIALELASIYAALGVRVTIADANDRLLPRADRDLVAVLRAHLDTILAEVALETVVAGHTSENDALLVDLQRTGKGADDLPPRRLRFDRLLVATGRHPNIASLGLERTKVSITDSGFIDVDRHLRTKDQRIFAIGDVLGAPMLAHKAAHQGRVAAEVIAGWGTEFDARAVPRVLFTDPQIAWCGLTETDAAARGEIVATTRTSWSDQGRTTCFQRTEGFTKIVHDPETHLVLGVGVVGPGAGELIAEAALAIEMGAVTSDLAATIHPCPSNGESLSLAAIQAEEEILP